MEKNKKEDNKIKNGVQKIYNYILNDKFFIILAICIFAIDFFLVCIQNSIQVDAGHNSILKYAIIIMFVYQLIIFLVLKRILKKGVKLHNIFLIFALILGISYMIMLPIGGVPDEINHFLRSYEVSTGSLISVKKGDEVGNYLPSNIESAIRVDVMDFTYKDIINHSTIKYNDDKVFYNYANTTLYSFVSYIPQALGILIGRILHFPIVITAYIGRLINFLLWTFIMYMCIKYIPVGKKVLFLVAFIPISLQEAISLSPDALINGLSVALLTFVTYHMYDKNKFKKKDYILMCALCILIALVKIVYLPLCLMVLLIPYKKFGNNIKEKYIKIGALALATIVLNLIWLKISSGFLIEFNPGVNSDKQLSFILHHPFDYLMVFAKSHNSNFMTYLFTLLGSNMEWLNVYISQPYLFIYLLIILFVAIREKNIKLVSQPAKSLFAFIAISVIILISTSLYIQWTPLMAPEINGLVQGRYFIPILVPILFILLNNNNKKDINHPEYFYYFALTLNSFVLMVLMYTHIY